MKWLALAAMLLVSCSPRSGRHKPLVGAVEEVGYDTVRPLFARYCAGCHPSRSSPDWLDFTQARTFALNGRLAQRVIVDRSMPPPQTAESAAIEEKDRRTLAAWARSGAPMVAKGKPEIPLDPGEVEAQACFQCHGSNGPGSEPRAAKLAGQNEEYLVLQLTRFKWRERIDPAGRMNDISRLLSSETIRKVARYFANRTVTSQPQPPQDLEQFERGRRIAGLICNTCHMSAAHGGRPPSGWVPVLKNQSKAYLIDQILYFRSQERRSPLMYQFVKDLAFTDIEALVQYYSCVGAVPSM